MSSFLHKAFSFWAKGPLLSFFFLPYYFCYFFAEKSNKKAFRGGGQRPFIVSLLLGKAKLVLLSLLETFSYARLIPRGFKVFRFTRS